MAIEEQSPDIAQSVDAVKLEDIGAGDQGPRAHSFFSNIENTYRESRLGIMFGYATDETETLMPLTHNLATSLGSRLTEVRKNGICPWVRPDGKTQVCLCLCIWLLQVLTRGCMLQVTCEYRLENGRPIPVRVHTIVISTQHSEDITNEDIRVGSHCYHS